MTRARRRHAPEAYQIQKRKIASAIPARNSRGRTFAAYGGRIGHRRLVDSGDGSRPGISVVPVTRRLPLLFLSDPAAMSVDGIGHRRLRLESALAIPEQAARFQREPGPVQKAVELGNSALLSWATAPFMPRAQPPRVYFRARPRLAKTNPRASAAQRSWPANLRASLRSGPGGIWRASSRASAATWSQSSLASQRCVSLLIAPQSPRSLNLLSPWTARLCEVRRYSRLQPAPSITSSSTSEIMDAEFQVASATSPVSICGTASTSSRV
jgi:hypothetical protein